MKLRARDVLIPLAALALTAAVFLGITAADKYLIRAADVPLLNAQLFRSGDGFFTLLVCDGYITVLCPEDAAGAKALTDSLKRRGVEKIDLLVLSSEASYGAIKGSLGAYAETSGVITPGADGASQSFRLGAADASITYASGAYCLRVKHAGKTLSFCGGAAFDGSAAFSDGTDFAVIPRFTQNGGGNYGFIEKSGMTHAVICDGKDDPADEDLLAALRKNNVKFIRTFNGNVGLRSENGDLFLLPDNSAIW